MHTKTHMWGRRCERGVRVLRACAHGASICVAVAPRRVSAMDTNVANLRVAFLHAACWQTLRSRRFRERSV